MVLSFPFFKKLCFIISILFFVFDSPIKGDQNIDLHYKTKNKFANLDWDLDNNKSNFEKIRWQLDETSYPNYKLLKPLNIYSRKSIKVKGIGKAVTINGKPYPEISNYVPNGFVEDWQKTITLSTRAISKVRSCNGDNFSAECVDGILDLDFNLINTEKFSFNPKVTLQSLTNRATAFGEGISLGFKMARNINQSWSISLGGENIIHLDDKTDLGRNYYIVGSTFYKINKSENPAVIFLNAGIGSDYYGFRGNGFLFKTPCLGSPNLTGENNNQCSWGPIASASIAFNDRFAFINEWFGYSYGTGISLRPFKTNTLNFSIYATDFIKGLPSYAADYCHKSECTTRYYGSLSFTF